MRTLPSILLFLSAWTAAAQMDEGPPVIRRSPSSPIGQPSQDKSGSDSKDSNKKIPDTTTASGIVQRIDAKSLIVAIDDGRIFNAAITSQTAFIGPKGKIDQDLIRPGLRVRISVKSNEDQDFTATSVVVEAPKVASIDSTNPASAKLEDGDAAKPEDDAATRKTEDTDPGRPVLKRGIPQKVAKKTDDDDADDAPSAPPAKLVERDTVASASKPSEGEGDGESLAGALKADNQPELLKKAYQSNMEFIAHLPNFVCQQFTTRYERENKIGGWQARDIVSATVVYESRKERYENVKINNKPANADMMGIKGSRSTSEFGSFLEGLFAPDVNASFRYLHAESFRQVHTKVFEYKVRRENTDWTVSNGGQSIRPAYSGRVWMDSETGRVMRIERQADDIPEAFPFNVVEETVDYDTVMLGGRKILLPVESSNLSCQRGSSFCSKNSIQFRDYKEFRGDATVTFDK